MKVLESVICFGCVLMVVAGKPQFHPKGFSLDIVKNSAPVDKPGGIQLIPVPAEEAISEKQMPDFTAFIQSQVFIGRADSNGELVKIHETKWSFPISISDIDKARKDSGECPRANEVRYEADNKCYVKGNTPGIETPCPSTPFKVYAERGDKPGYGDCFCSEFVGNTRPVVYWEGDDGCYWLYDQGPCKAGEWLVFKNVTGAKEAQLVDCGKRTCPENEGSKNNPEFWFEHNGKCLKTETENPEFCGDAKQKIYFSAAKPEPECSDLPILPTQSKSLAGGAGYLRCKPGYKPQANRECKRIATFE